MKARSWFSVAAAALTVGAFTAYHNGLPANAICSAAFAVASGFAAYDDGEAAAIRAAQAAYRDVRYGLDVGEVEVAGRILAGIEYQRAFTAARLRTASAYIIAFAVSLVAFAAECAA